MPTFSGNTLEWQPFWDGFDAAVHTNPAISEVQKLNYLRSLLKGEASQVIAGFPLTSDSYEHSLALLKDRYGTPYKLIMAHMQAFVDLSSPPNTLSGLQQFHDTVERHIRSLSTLGKSTDSYADILVPIILNKLPPATIKNMAREHDSNDWSLTDLQQAIKKEVRVFEAEIMTGNSPSGIHPTAAFHTGLVKTVNRSTGQPNHLNVVVPFARDRTLLRIARRCPPAKRVRSLSPRTVFVSTAWVSTKLVSVPLSIDAVSANANTTPAFVVRSVQRSKKLLNLKLHPVLPPQLTPLLLLQAELPLLLPTIHL